MNAQINSNADAAVDVQDHRDPRRKMWNRDFIQAVAATLLVVGSILVAELRGDFYWIPILQLTALYVVASVFMSILLVDAGQVSFGNGAVFGIAAYAVGIACGIHGLPFWIGALLGVAAALCMGLLFALPALRVQWFYLGFVTLSAAMVLIEMLYAFDAYTNGIVGIPVFIPSVSAPAIGSISLLSLLVVVVCVASFVLHYWIPRTRLGRGMRIAAASPEAARSLGVSPGYMRFSAFLIAAAGTGMAGTLYPPVVGFVSPNAFPLDLSILFFFAIIVGGRGHVLGAVLGVVLLYVVPNILLAQFAQYRLFAYGAIALIIMLLMPKGIIGTLVHWRKRARPDLGSAISSAVSELVKSVPKGEVASPVDDRSPVAVQVSGLCKTFGRVVALDDVSLTVARGEIHGLVGANGSGKSTLLNILSGFYAIDTGSVSIKDRRVENLSVRSIAQAGVGRTFQTPRIFTDLTLWENLQAGIDANPPGNEPPFADQALKRLRDLLGDERVDNVAHGQRRLLEVVRVILTGADILLLDEPAAGLSEEERASFSHLLVRLRDDLGKTIILVEHDLRLVWGIADQITVLDTGKVIASGTPAQLLSDPVASKLFLGAADA